MVINVPIKPGLQSECKACADLCAVFLHQECKDRLNFYLCVTCTVSLPE